MRTIQRRAWVCAALLGCVAVSCTVDAGPAPTACDPSGGCRSGYVCNAATSTCVRAMHRVSVALAGAGSGTVRSMTGGIDCGTTCTVDLSYGTTITLDAMPDAMSTFAGWTGDCSGMGPCMLVADHDVSVTATFARRAFDLTVTPMGAGRGHVVSMPTGIDCGTGCVASYDIGTRVTLTATPDPGSTFEGWTGDCTGSTACAVTMDMARSVGAAFSPGGVLWAKSFGNTDYDSAMALAVDPSGDVVTGGYFQGDVDFGGGALRSAGAEEIFVAKYAGSDGAHRWSARFGGIDADRAQAIAVDASGDVFVGGLYSETVDFGLGPNTSGGIFDFFAAKLSGADGHVLWVRTAGGLSTDMALGAAVDPAGDLVIVGEFGASVDFGSGTPLTSSGPFDGFVMKLRGTDGAHVWSTRIGGPGSDIADKIAIDSTGRIFVAGTFDQDMTLGTSPLLHPRGNTDVYVVELSSADGSFVHATSYGGTGFDYSNALGLDGTDDTLVLAAAFDGTASFGGATPLVSGGFLDIALAKYTPGGAHLWSQGTGGTGREYGYGLAPTSRGIALVGTFTDMIDVGHVLTSAGDDDVLVASFASADGSIVWGRRFGGTGPDEGIAIGADATGGLFVAGGFEAMMDLDGTPLTSVGLGDVFVVKLGN